MPFCVDISVSPGTRCVPKGDQILRFPLPGMLSAVSCMPPEIKVPGGERAGQAPERKRDFTLNQEQGSVLGEVLTEMQVPGCQNLPYITEQGKSLVWKVCVGKNGKRGWREAGH